MRIIRKLVFVVIILGIIGVLYHFNVIPHKQYTNQDFGIEDYIATSDADQDGIDDLSDMLQGVKQYLDTKPVYKSVYYATGYPDDQYGVCTDVVGFGLLAAGYSLMDMVYDDIWLDRSAYPYVDVVDIHIDFRRVENLQSFFARNYQPLTNDIYCIDQWQGGDIVIFEGHVGVVAEVRNYKGISFVYHNGSPYQGSYLQDILETYGEVVGHYRVAEEYRIKGEN